MKTNIVLLMLLFFIVSLIITLNVFFQQSYQSEMAEQFNRQQLLVAKTVALNIENDMERLSEETLSFATYLAERGLGDGSLGEFVNDVFAEGRSDIVMEIKIFDAKGNLRYSSISERADERDIQVLAVARTIPQGETQWIDLLSTEGKVLLLAPITRSSGYQGALILELIIDDVSRKFLAPIRSGIRGHAWMMDSQGTLLYHPTQPMMVGKNLYESDTSCFECHASFESEKKILQSEGVGFSSYIAPYGEDKLVAFSRARLNGMSWIVCVSIPYSEVTFSVRKSLKLHSLLVISIFVATIIGASAIVTLNRQRTKAEEKAIRLEREKALKKEIIQTKDYLENILQSTESKIMVLDTSMVVRTVNSAHERLCSRNKDEIVGKSFFDVFPIDRENDGKVFSDIFGECLEGKNRRISNYPYRRNNEETLYLNISISPLVLHNVVSGIILSSSNITEEVNLREELKKYAARLEDLVKERTAELLQEKEKLNAIVETLEAGLFLVDDRKTITWINRKLKEWIGEENLDQLSLDAIYGVDKVERSIVDNTLIQEVIYGDLGRRKGYFQITSTPLVSGEGHTQALVLVQDITEMKRMEEQMMHSEKLSALARISAGVAHEIGNPLTSISSYVQILREMDHDEFTKESLDTIAKHINRIADIVRQMSSFSKTTSPDVKPQDVGDLIGLTLDLVKYDRRMKHIDIMVDIPEDLPRVNGNETQLIQVFMNLILNSADAMASSGELHIAATRADGEVEISFSDTGPGIPPENIEKIFDPFFTTKEMGTGLGLAVSYSIIKSYQGDILVENQPEGGALFKVRLRYNER